MAQIEYFLKVAKTLNYTEAAKELYISQPALSKQILLLEKDLGVRLFERDNRHVELTAAGVKLQDEMKPLIRRMALVMQEVGRLKFRDGVIRVGCFDGLDTQTMIDDLERRLRLAGAAGVEITLYKVSEIREQIRSGGIDFGIILDFSLPFFDGYEHQVLESRKGGIVFSGRHPLAGKERLTMADFSGQTFVAVSDDDTPGGETRLIANLERCGIVPGRIVRVSNIMTLASYIDRGRGVTLLSKEVNRRGGDEWRVWELPAAEMPLRVVAVYEKSRFGELAGICFEGYNR